MAKERAFLDKLRNARIRAGELELEVRLSDLPLMNKTELIQVCNMIISDAKAHHGLTREEVERMITVGETNTKGNPVDPYRDRLLAFLKQHWEKIKDQLDIYCGADCYQCTDAMVLGCYLTNQRRLEKEQSNAEEEKDAEKRE